MMKFLLLALFLSQAHAADPKDDQLARDLLRELIDIDTTHSLVVAEHGVCRR